MAQGVIWCLSLTGCTTLRGDMPTGHPGDPDREPVECLRTPPGDQGGRQAVPGSADGVTPGAC